VQGLLDFSAGPLFRLTFFIMVLGLARILILDIWGAVDAYRKAGDKTIDWGTATRKTIKWLIPIKSVFTHKPFYSIFSISFHVGLILVPIFLLAHVRLWETAIGFGWLSLPKTWADILTLVAIIAGAGIIIGRIASSNLRFLSRKQDYLWPLLLIIPFVTGYICSNMAVSPATYQLSKLIHILSGELIFVLIPFTKITHCVIMPLSQFIMMIAWKFPAHVDDDICTTLNKKGEPV